MHAIWEILFNILQDSNFMVMWIDAFLKSLIILALAGGVCLGWRRASAATRHLIWFLALVSLLVLPWLSSMLPAWQQPIWSVSGYPSPQNEYIVTLEFTPASEAKVPIEKSLASAPEGQSPSHRPNHLGNSPGVAASIHQGWMIPLLVVWLMGVGLGLGSLVAGQLGLWLIGRRCRVVMDAELRELFERLRQELHIRRRVALWQSDDNVMPMTWGGWRPVVLLPDRFSDWSEERLRVVLLHELAHVKRWDCLTQTVSRLVCSLYWFNPLVWLAWRRLRIEREVACDDLVLNEGCQASEYASHLLDIARSFRPFPMALGIAMARSAKLENRIRAIVDATRPRFPLSLRLLSLCCAAVLGMVMVVAAQKSDVERTSNSEIKSPWYESRLRAFFASQFEMAQVFLEKERRELDPEILSFFQAGIEGDWATTTNLWADMQKRIFQDKDIQLGIYRESVVWPVMQEAVLIQHEFENGQEKSVRAFGERILESIPPGCIYFGGTDAGRGVITLMSESPTEGKPFFVLAPDVLANPVYAKYLRAKYGEKINLFTAEESKNTFDEYIKGAINRLAANQLEIGENVKRENGRVTVSGRVAVTIINGMLAKLIFDQNPDREFYIEENYSQKWMYPHLSPHGPILKINRQELAFLSSETVDKDREYWTQLVKPLIGNWLDYDTSLNQVIAFVEQVYLQNDLGGLKGDRQFIQDPWARSAFSKLRSSIGGVYAWRANHAKNESEKTRMVREADFAFRQAWALCPTFLEIAERYVELLKNQGRITDARRIVETIAKFPAPPGRDLGHLKRLMGEIGEKPVK